MKARAPALRTCPATCVSPSRPHRDLIAVFKVGLWLRWPGQYSFPEPATHALSRCAVQSLPVRRPSQATQDVLRSNFEHEGCRPVRYTGPIERKVATGTRTVCAESTLALVWALLFSGYNKPYSHPCSCVRWTQPWRREPGCSRHTCHCHCHGDGTCAHDSFRDQCI